MLNRCIKILSIFLLLTSFAYAQEVLFDLENKSTVILNEELRKSRNDIRNNDIDIAALSAKFFLPSGAVFFMITGSCPSGTTDVTTTYSDMFVRINATQGTTSGVNTHTHELADGTNIGTSDNYTDNERISKWRATGELYRTSNGGGSLQTNTRVASYTTTSGNNIPTYVTMKCCSVN